MVVDGGVKNEGELQRLREEIRLLKEAQVADGKLSAVKLQQVEERYLAMVSTKDAAIASFEEKISLLESDFNKRDALIRSLKERTA